MPASKVSVTLVFQSPSGAPLANGQVQIKLNQDASLGTSGGPSVSTKTILAALDSSGSVTLSLWPNDLLLPIGSIYFVNAFSAIGEPAWSGQMTFHS